jgi:hypothetical protein
MSKSICTTVQRELDEMTLGENGSVTAFEHLAQCAECCDFNQKQSKLREIVGSLGMVSAPPDFEFRLRSRIARDNEVSRPFSNLWSMSQRSAAVATALVLLLGGALLVSQRIKRDTLAPSVAQNNEPLNPAPASSPKEKSTGAALGSTHDQHTPSTVGPPATETIAIKRTAGAPRHKRNTVAADFSSLQAPVIQGSETIGSNDSVFPVDASQQSLKVSLLDGRGNRRTISVPTVSFGSQRVVPTTSSFAPKGVW